MCEVCGRKVADSQCNRSHFMAKVCPGSPKALSPEEAALRDKRRGYYETYRQRLLARRPEVARAGGELPPAKRSKGAAATAAAPGSRQNATPSPAPPPLKGKQGREKNFSREKSDTPGSMGGAPRGGALASLRCRKGPDLRRAEGEHLRRAPEGKPTEKKERVAAAVAPPPVEHCRPRKRKTTSEEGRPTSSEGKRTAKKKRVPAAAAPPPPPKPHLATQGRKPQPKRRGRAAPSAPE